MPEEHDELVRYLLLNTDILTRLRWLVSSTNPASGALSEDECNRRLHLGVSCANSLLRGYMGQATDDTIIESFVMLLADLAALVPLDMREFCHVSTYFLIRCLLHTMVPLVRGFVANSELLSNRLGLPHHRESEEHFACALRFGAPLSVREFYGTGTQPCNFLDATSVTILHHCVLESILDCAFCRLVLFVMDVMNFSVPAGIKLLNDWKPIWLPTLQALSNDAGVPFVRSHDGFYHVAPNVSPDHVAYDLIAHLLDSMNLVAGPRAPYARAFPRLDIAAHDANAGTPWFFSNHCAQVVGLFPEIGAVVTGFCESFSRSSLVHTPIEQIQQGLGYYPFPLTNWRRYQDVTGRTYFYNLHTNTSTYIDPRIVPRHLERYVYHDYLDQYPEPYRTTEPHMKSGMASSVKHTKRPSGPRTRSRSPTRSPATRYDLREPAIANRAALVNTMDGQGEAMEPHALATVLDSLEDIPRQLDFDDGRLFRHESKLTRVGNVYTGKEWDRWPTTPTQSRVVFGSTTFIENATGQPSGSDDDSLHSKASTHLMDIDYNITLLKAPDRDTIGILTATQSSDSLCSLAESEGTSLWSPRGRRLMRATVPEPFIPSPVLPSTTATPMSALVTPSSAPNLFVQSAATGTDDAPQPTGNLSESSAPRADARQENILEDVAYESQREMGYRRLQMLLGSPGRDQPTENRRAHAVVSEAAQTAQFLDDEEDHTEEPRQML
ncbi:hypothetical protein PENSPDRAFT_348952 [Peniophora sp. CONT]|nr:hypothetical protein PENSPDRAFT_348952 [Peniophora sp. CONT]